MTGAGFCTLKIGPIIERYSPGVTFWNKELKVAQTLRDTVVTVWWTECREVLILRDTYQ